MGQREQGLLGGSVSHRFPRLVVCSFLGISPGGRYRGWKLLHGCHGNQHLHSPPPPLTTPASQEAPGGRHRFAAGATGVGGVTGLLASRLRY